MLSEALREAALDAAHRASAAILPYYRRAGTAVDQKGDGSPITQADRAAHRAITARLADTGLPVVSEEGDDLQLDRSDYWLVDPLDGTKDFLAGNDEFTVNIAVIRDGAPIWGIVLAPALQCAWTGGVGVPTREISPRGRREATTVPRAVPLRVAVSRFHDHPDVGVFVAEQGEAVALARGSALKYCQLAFADADVFPRLVGCSEWDTAAGQAVLEAAGGAVLDWHTRLPLRYGKPGRRNPRLLSFRAPYRADDFVCRRYPAGLL